MARIETYTPDFVITPNDKVIGTDGDSNNATKNFPVIAMLDYLGTNFNLQSADLVYNYTTEDENTLNDGEFTANAATFAVITIFYISKTTVFGKLIDDYIQTVSDETYSFMIYDFSDYNNFGFYNIVSAVSLNADTFTVTVAYQSGNGSPQDTLSHGLKVYPPTGSGGDDLGDHIATQNLDINGNNILNVSNMFPTTGSASIGQATADGDFFNGYFTRISHRATDGEYWIQTTATVSQKLGWAKVANSAGGVSLLYTLDKSGQPIQSTDLVHFAYLNNNFAKLDANNVFTGATNTFVGVSANSVSAGAGGFFTSGSFSMNGTATIRGGLSLGETGGGYPISMYPSTAVPNYTGSTSQAYFSAYENGSDKGFFFVPHTNGNATIFNVGNATQNNSHTMPNKSGTVAHLSDIGGAPAWGDITGTLSAQTDLQSALNGKASTATTLSGYGITNAYTKTETDNKYLLNTTDTLTGDFTATGNILTTARVGAGTSSPDAALHSHEMTALGSTAGNSQLIARFEGEAGNDIKRDLYLVRNATGSDWLTTSVHDSIAIDTSFTTPQTNTKTWWERDPHAGSQAWGNAATTGMTLSSTGDLGVTGDLDVTGAATVTDQAYGASWDGSTEVPTKNAVYDKIESISNNGSFTPTITTTGGGATYTYGVQNGRYSVNGDAVTIAIELSNITTTGTPSGRIRITGLPSAILPVMICVLNVRIYGADVNFYSIHALVYSGQDYIEIETQQALDGNNTFGYLNAISSTTSWIYITGTYITA